MSIISTTAREGYIELRNNKGESVWVSEAATLRQLVAEGIKHVGLVTAGIQLPDGWYVTLEDRL